MVGRHTSASGQTFIPEERIARSILLIRGHKVMLDEDSCRSRLVPSSIRWWSKDFTIAKPKPTEVV